MSLVGKQREYYGPLKSDLYGVGVTAQRLVLQPLDKRQQSRGEPVWITGPEVVNCAIWGEGDG